MRTRNPLLASPLSRRAATVVEYVVIVCCLLLVLIVVVHHVGSISEFSFTRAAQNSGPPPGALDDLPPHPGWADIPVGSPVPPVKKKPKEKTDASGGSGSGP